jgi:single-strand DNA-binding protein
MASVNKVILIGHLGQDPELRYIPNGDATTTISIATTETWKDKAGEKQENTEWHRCIFWRRAAEVVAEYAKKGSQMYVEGKLQTRKWTDKDGVDRYTTEIVASEFKFLGNKGTSDEGRSPRGEAARPRREASGGRSKSSFDDMEDDTPF